MPSLIEFANWIVLMLTAGAAGALNAVAGGGSFLLFPALNTLANLTEKMANTTCTLVVWPGSLASVVATRKELHQAPRYQLLALTLVSLLGGLLGAYLLLGTSEKSFRRIIPWLLGFGTVVFALSPRITAWVLGPHGKLSIRQGMYLVVILQFMVAVYGGYFGAGIGILMLANLALTGHPNLHVLNAMKVWLGTSINLMALLMFIGYGSVDWHHGWFMVLAAIFGGYFGSALARKIAPSKLRSFILGIGTLLTVVYAWKTS